VKYAVVATIILAVGLVISPALAQAVPAPGGISIRQAQDIALSLYPGAAVVLAELTFEGNVQAWDVKLNNGIAVYINASTGAILETEPWQNSRQQGMLLPPTSTDINAPPGNMGANGVSFEQARTIALSLYPNTTVVEAKLELKRSLGVQAWDVKLSNGIAVYINALTGQVIELETWGRSSGRPRSEVRPGRQEPPPWAGSPGGRRAWEARQQRPAGGAAPIPPGSNLQPMANLSLKQAVEIARAQFPDTQLVEAELTRWDNGAPAWDVKLSNGLAVYVDAQTGAVLEVEPYR